jgi:hypothetical protein
VRRVSGRDDPALEAVVRRAPDIDEGDAGPVEKRPGLRRDVVGRDDLPGAVNDALLRAIAPDDVVGRGEHLGRVGAGGRGRTVFGTEKDRPGLGIGVLRGEGAVGEDEIRLPLRDLPQTMAAGHPVAVGDPAFDFVSIGVAATGADVGDDGGGKSGEMYGHGPVSLG